MRRSRWLGGIFFAVLVCSCCLRLVQLVEPMGIDQGIFATAGWGLSRGLTLYRDLWDQKPPGIHLTYLAGFALFGARPATVVWLDLLASLATTALLLGLASRAVDRRFGLLASILFLVGTLPAAKYSLGGFLERAVPETFICLFVTAAVWCAFELRTGGHRAAALGLGLLIGLAAVYKPTAFVYWPPLIVWSLWKRPARDWSRAALVAGAGVAVAPIATLAWLWWHGALGDAWVAVVQYNRAYVTAGPGILTLFDRFAHEVWRRIKTDPLWLAGTAGALGAVWVCRRQGANRPVAVLGVLWLSMALVAAAANGVRLYNSYFIPPLVPLALLAASLVYAVLWHRSRIAKGLALAILLLAGHIGGSGGYFTRTIDATRADVRQVLNRSGDPGAFLERFGGYGNGRGYSARANAELTAYLQSRTDPADRVFIFGMEPGVYFTSRRLPASRFLWVGPAVSTLFPHPEFRLEAMMAELERAAPTCFILERHNRDSLLGWTIEEEFARRPVAEFLRNYELATEIEDFVVYRRRGVP